MAMNSPNNDFGESAEFNRRRKSTVSSPCVDMREEAGMTEMIEDPAFDTELHVTKDEPVDIEIKLEPEDATTNIPGYSDMDGVVLHEIQKGANQGTSDSLIIKQEATDWPSSPSPIPESNMEPLISKTLKGKGNSKSTEFTVQGSSEWRVLGCKSITSNLENFRTKRGAFPVTQTASLKTKTDSTHSAKSTNKEGKQAVHTQTAEDPNPQYHSQNASTKKHDRLTNANIASTKPSSVNSSQTENPALDGDFFTQEANDPEEEGGSSCNETDVDCTTEDGEEEDEPIKPNLSKLLQSKTKKRKKWKLYQCKQCNYSHTHKHRYDAHMRRHYRIKLYKCNIEGCEYKASRSYDLKRHKELVHSKKKYICAICDEVVKSETALRTHAQLFHPETSKDKLFSCSKCDFKAVWRHLIIRHERTHTGDKPWKCTECSYASTQKINLQTHMKTHTGDKPWKCTECSYASTWKTNLESHMRTHTGEKPYKCPHCDYAAALNVTLKRHIKTTHPNPSDD